MLVDFEINGWRFAPPCMRLIALTADPDFTLAALIRMADFEWVEEGKGYREWLVRSNNQFDREGGCLRRWTRRR
jgi:hypothetical protein